MIFSGWKGSRRGQSGRQWLYRVLKDEQEFTEPKINKSVTSRGNKRSHLNITTFLNRTRIHCNCQGKDLKSKAVDWKKEKCFRAGYSISHLTLRALQGLALGFTYFYVWSFLNYACYYFPLSRKEVFLNPKTKSYTQEFILNLRISPRPGIWCLGSRFGGNRWAPFSGPPACVSAASPTPMCTICSAGHSFPKP